MLARSPTPPFPPIPPYTPYTLSETSMSELHICRTLEHHAFLSPQIANELAIRGGQKQKATIANVFSDMGGVSQNLGPHRGGGVASPSMNPRALVNISSPMFPSTMPPILPIREYETSICQSYTFAEQLNISCVPTVPKSPTCWRLGDVTKKSTMANVFF